jgi:hypothetical protein
VSTFRVYVRFWWSLQALGQSTHELARLVGNLQGQEPTDAEGFLLQAERLAAYTREVAGRMITFQECLREVQCLEPEEQP